MVFFAAVGLSALVAHELGHALCALAWGSRAKIVLHALGAHTEIEPALPRGREIVAALMGPIVSLAFGLALAALRMLFPGHEWLKVPIGVNLAWGVINLLPLLPFDGGRMLLAFVGQQRRASTLLISGILAAIVAVEGLAVVHSAALAFLFGAAAVASLLAWARRRQLEIEQALGLPTQVEAARRLLSLGEAETARRLATRLAHSARLNTTANAAWEVLAWAELELDRPEDAYRALLRIRPASAVGNYCRAAVEAARGHQQHAINLLEAELRGETPCVDAIKLLIDLHARLGRLPAACGVASSEITRLEPDDVRLVIEAAYELNAFTSGTKLAEKLFELTGSPDDAVIHAYGLARLGDHKTARRILSELVARLASWTMHKKTLKLLRDLAMRPESCEILDPALIHLL